MVVCRQPCRRCRWCCRFCCRCWWWWWWWWWWRCCYSRCHTPGNCSTPVGYCTDPEPKIWAASPDENTPRGPNQAVRPIPGGHGTEGVPPSWSLHRVRASVWASRVQVKPPGAAGRRGAVVPAGALAPACAALWHPGRPPSSRLGRGGTRLPPAPVAARPLNQRSSPNARTARTGFERGVEA